MRGGRRAARSRRGRLARLTALLGAATLLSWPAPAAPQEPQVLARDSVRVVYWPGDRGAARLTLEAALRPLPLPGIPGEGVRAAGTIVLAPSAALFDSLTHGRAPDWSAGVAFPSRRLIILPAYASARTALGDPVVTLRHELAHLALNAYLHGRVPRWFDEGYATWVSGGWDESSGWRIRFALLRGQAPPLDSLSLHWPAGEARARLAYLLSSSAVRHLATRSGEPAFTALLAAWREQGSLDAALRSTYQMTLWQFEEEWRRMVRDRYGWLLALSQAGVFWLALTLLFLLLGAARRRRDRDRLAALRAEEYMLPPPTEAGVDEDSRPG